MQTLSHAHIECLINGHRFTGWAEDDPPYEWEFEEAAEFVEGQDGGLYGVSMPRLGCGFMFKMAPNSPTTQWAMQQEQMRKNSHLNRNSLRVYEGTFSDPVQGVSWHMAGGAIKLFPATRVAGVTYEGSLRFELITASVDGGVFQAPLTNSGSRFSL